MATNRSLYWRPVHPYVSSYVSSCGAVGTDPVPAHHTGDTDTVAQEAGMTDVSPLNRGYGMAQQVSD
jgi:hypothetical protein